MTELSALDLPLELSDSANDANLQRRQQTRRAALNERHNPESLRRRGFHLAAENLASILATRTTRAPSQGNVSQRSSARCTPSATAFVSPPHLLPTPEEVDEDEEEPPMAALLPPARPQPHVNADRWLVPAQHARMDSAPSRVPLRDLGPRRARWTMTRPDPRRSPTPGPATHTSLCTPSATPRPDSPTDYFALAEQAEMMDAAAIPSPAAPAPAIPPIVPPGPPANGFTFVPAPPGGFPKVHFSHPFALYDGQTRARVAAIEANRRAPTVMLQIARVGFPALHQLHTLMHTLGAAVQAATAATNHLVSSPAPQLAPNGT
ncbi:hypothetical protein GY45DRAFT_1376142 [Cubamyces sp. BRFM 1775]|nr:hypothetical protein GY45DRAFT_1376142 [Cubamyces sp. BRFM 1775]